MAVDQDFQQLLADYAPMIQRIAQTYERRPALVQEVVQEAAFALWRALPGFRGDSSMRTFVGRIAHNVCVSHVRKEAKGPALVNAYGQKVSRSRLVAAGVGPDAIVAIKAETYDLSEAGGGTARISSSLIYVF